MGSSAHIERIILCRFGWHDWNPWGPRYEVKVSTLPLNSWTGDVLPCGPVTHFIHKQDRVCRDCNAMQTRQIRG